MRDERCIVPGCLAVGSRPANAPHYSYASQQHRQRPARLVCDNRISSRPPRPKDAQPVSRAGYSGGQRREGRATNIQGTTVLITS